MDIVHRAEQHRFEVTLDEGAAVLEYILDGRTMPLTHTYVPNAARGRGVASKMTAAALEYAHAQDLTVVPLCSFAVSYMTRQERRNART